MIKTYDFAIYSNDQAGILNRITAVFSRVNLNIDALSVCESAEPGIFRHSVQVRCDHQTAARSTSICRSNCLLSRAAV